MYNIEELKEEIKKYIEEKDNLIKTNLTNNNNLKIWDKELKESNKNNKSRDNLISQKISDIDVEVQNVNPRLVENTIEQEEKELKDLNTKLKAYGDK